MNWDEIETDAAFRHTFLVFDLQVNSSASRRSKYRSVRLACFLSTGSKAPANFKLSTPLQGHSILGLHLTRCGGPIGWEVVNTARTIPQTIRALKLMMHHDQGRRLNHSYYEQKKIVRLRFGFVSRSSGKLIRSFNKHPASNVVSIDEGPHIERENEDWRLVEGWFK